MFEVIKHTEDEFGPFIMEYGVINENALNRILDTAAEHEKVEFKEVN